MAYFWKDYEEGVDYSSELSLLKVIYKNDYYQQIKYVPDFGFESFWSGVGGFVGIFLGYSMMQFPEMMGNYVLASIQYFYSTRIR